MDLNRMPDNTRPLSVELRVALSEEEFDWLSAMADHMEWHVVGVLRVALRLGLYHWITDKPEVGLAAEIADEGMAESEELDRVAREHGAWPSDE